MSSRLFVNIRSKLGLVYTISANINNYLEGGYFSIDFQTNPNATKRCISAVEKELAIIREKGFSRQEFTRIHNNYISEVLMCLEYNNTITEFYGEQLLYYNKIETFESYFEKIKNINLSDINKLAASFLKKYKIIIYGRSV
jgi:predicted Zn-dependent peptidase